MSSATPDALTRIEASADLAGAAIGHTDARATIIVVFASWCPHCHDQLGILGSLRHTHPGMRIVGVNYTGHEEYNQLGGSDAVRAYVAEHAPWLRVVPCDEACFAALGRPPVIPATFVYDQAGALVEHYDRRERPEPTREEIETLLQRLGA